MASTTNSQIGKDAFGFSLNYYTNDYKSSNTGMLAHSKAPGAINPNLSNGTTWNLYNGNIGRMITTITDPSNHTALPMGIHESLLQQRVPNKELLKIRAT